MPQEILVAANCLTLVETVLEIPFGSQKVAEALYHTSYKNRFSKSSLLFEQAVFADSQLVSKLLEATTTILTPEHLESDKLSVTETERKVIMARYGLLDGIYKSASSATDRTHERVGLSKIKHCRITYVTGFREIYSQYSTDTTNNKVPTSKIVYGLWSEKN